MMNEVTLVAVPAAKTTIIHICKPLLITFSLDTAITYSYSPLSQ